MVQIHPEWTKKCCAVLLGCISVSWDVGRGELKWHADVIQFQKKKNSNERVRLMIFDDRLLYQLSPLIKGSCSFYSQHLYMHCEISIGSFKATPSAKSCTYNQSINGMLNFGCTESVIFRTELVLIWIISSDGKSYTVQMMLASVVTLHVCLLDLSGKKCQVISEYVVV